MQVLVIDEDSRSNAVLAAIFEELRVDARVLTEVAGALESLRTDMQVAMVLLGHRHGASPHNAFLVRRLKSIFNAPVLVMTDDVDWLAQDGHIASGFDGACLKPIDKRQIVDAILFHNRVTALEHDPQPAPKSPNEPHRPPPNFNLFWLNLNSFA